MATMKTKQKKQKKRKVLHRSKRLPKGSHGGIELLLIHSVENLGAQGDVVEVRPGYAQNYLLPQGLGTIATDHHKRMVEKHRSQLQAMENAQLAGLKEIAAQLAKQSVTIEAKATEDGHLYGSVGSTEISAALKQIDFSIHADQIRLEGPLKELGLYTVKVHFSGEVEGELKVWVVPLSATEEAVDDASK